jgi:fatty-acyl-CoA synthase
MIVHGERAISYGQSLDEIYRLARALVGVGFRAGSGLAGLTENTPEILFLHLATQLAGGYYVGLPKHYSEAEQIRMAQNSGVTALAFDPGRNHLLATEISSAIPELDLLSLGSSELGLDLLAIASEQPAEVFDALGSEHDPGELVFTGGSTSGTPKAACHTLGQIGSLTRFWDQAVAAGEEDALDYARGRTRLLRFSPHITTPGLCAIPTMLFGGTIYLQDGFEEQTVLATIERERITTTHMTPAHLYRLLDHPALPSTDTSSLRQLIYHGAPMAPARLQEALERFGPVLMQSYGQTETRMITALFPSEHQRDRQRLFSLGRPRAGVELQIRDAGGVDVSPGEIGEVYVRSPYVMSGYWQALELTANTIDEQRYLRTGDLAWQDEEGYLHLVDRLADVVIVEAWNCYTVEIEQVLTSHPAVRHAAAVGLPDEQTGEAVHIAVVTTPGATVDDDELRSLVLAQLSTRHVPRSIVRLDELPLTSLGKPDKKAIRRHIAEVNAK